MHREGIFQCSTMAHHALQRLSAHGQDLESVRQHTQHKCRHMLNDPPQMVDEARQEVPQKACISYAQCQDS